MFAEEIRRAVQACQRGWLPELSAAVWKRVRGRRHQARARLNRSQRLIEARKAARHGLCGGPARRGRLASAVISLPGAPKGLDGLRMDAAEHRSTVHDGRGRSDRRHRGRDRRRGVRCMSCRSAPSPAGQGSVATIVRNALRQARILGLLHVEARRVARDRNLPNVVTIISRELELWVRTRSRVERQGGGYRSVVPATNHILSSSARPATTAWKAGLSVREVARSGPTGR